MYTVNDEMFALIIRFLGRYREVTFCDQDFIGKELQAIQTYVARFPPEEKEQRSFEWVERHAREFRKTWEKEKIEEEFSDQRCSDCPLAENDNLGHCQIHDQWLELLRQYVDGQIDSKKYVRDNLELLAQNKERLRIKLSKIKG